MISIRQPDFLILTNRVCAALAVSLFVIGGSANAQNVDFARDIQPILNSKCIECHGGVKSASGLSFVYENRVLNFEAESGYVVVTPGNLDESELVARISSDDDGDRMPPPDAHGPLTEKEIALIKAWVKSGAKWNGHWAFTPPVRPSVPSSIFDEKANGNVDRFLFDRLEHEGLQPSATEEPGRLLRRLSLALTGLPPTLKELDAFELACSQDSKSAIENAVDELMKRDSFGERWASMWLDLVRYADSGGLGIDQRRTIWPYRDWVVQALNDDMPFDQFTVKQLAGDLLPSPTTDDLIATACHRNTQTNNEGGTDDEEFRVEAIIDRVNTTWQTWGSMTFGCVQCHDHPYDPIRNVEYYRFMGFLNNSADSDLENDGPRLKVPQESKQVVEAEKLREKILKLKKEIWTEGTTQKQNTQWKGATNLEVGSQNGTKYSIEQKPDYAELFTVGTVPTKTQTRIQVHSSNFGGEPVTALRLTALPLDPKTSLHSPEWGFVITKLQAWVVTGDGTKSELKFRWSVPDVAWLPADPFLNIQTNGTNWGANSRIHHARELVLVPEKPFEVNPGSYLDVHVSCNKTGHGSHPMVIKRGHLASTSDSRWTEFAAPTSRLHQLSQELSQLTKRLNVIPGTSVPVMLQRPKQLLRPTHVFGRGNAMEKEDRVFAGMPATFTKYASIGNESSVQTNGLDRLDMAQWWVSEKNPLTARVFVNRVWAQLFGVGIVPTLEDFGSSGDKPTHRELLDYLAVRFQQDHNWSVKAIIREIVLSHAYQQSAKLKPEVLKLDPDNRLVARGPRLRVSAEIIRDQSLAFSGLLSNKLGGPPVHPPLPDGVWQPFDGKDKWATNQPNDEDRYRRSIYTYVKRSIPFPTFATFDAPSREFCTPRRLTSNTPLQALVILNDPAFVECAEAFGRRMQSEPGTVEERLARAYRLTTARTATPMRLKRLVQLHHEIAAQYENEDSKTKAKESKDSDLEIRPDENTWTVIAQVLLNLDEALTY